MLNNSIIHRVNAFLIIVALTLGLAASSSTAATIDNDLEQKIRSMGPDDRVSVLIMLSDKAEISPGIGRDKARHRESVIRKLREKADLTQGNIIAYLEAQGASDIQTLWIINGISALVPARIVRDLERIPGIQEIILNKELKAPVIPFGTTGGSATPEWNLSAIHAPELWTLGHTGQGIVIATMDTGVDQNHPDLAASYRGGANSWFDPHGQHATPFDASGHGTHVMGVLLGGSSGGTAIGVAPGATWIAFKLFDDQGATTYADIHSGFQWLLDPDGNPLTNDAPDVVNNSWGLSNSGACILDFQADIQALQSADIYIVFSAGNFGPTPSTSVSPANYPGNLSVGSVSQSMVIDSYSGRGPSQCDNSVYPVVVGPAGVRTAELTSGGTITNSYATLTGTSAAAPHIAGAAALLLSAMPTLTNAEIDAALKNTATDLGTVGPDNDYGYGFINAYAAFTSLAPHSISGTIRTSGGAVVPGVSMVLTGASTTTTGTDGSGNYVFANLIDGSYTVTPSLSTQTFSPLSTSVTISALAHPGTNFTLNTYTVAGTVRTPGSSPIAGVTLTLSGTADGFGAVSHAVLTGAQGQFAFPDVMNGSYTLTPSMAAAQSFTPVNRPVVVINGNITSQDFTITAYTISGAVRNTGGTAVPGVSLVLSGASTTATVSDASGNYVFANLVNGNYTVTPGLSGQTFTPATANVLIAAADVPSQNFTVNTISAPVPSKIGVHRNGYQWYVDANGNGSWDGADAMFSFGAAGDVPVTGDWNGNGRTKIGVVRNGYRWYLDMNGNGVWDAGDVQYNFGAPGDIPVTGDWNGSGTTKIGVFRNGFQWYLDMNGNGAWDGGDVIYSFGSGGTGDTPVTGDWNGSGTTKIGVFRNGFQWYLDANGNGTWGGADSYYAFGSGVATDTPVTGDWNGSGTTKIGIFRNGYQWYLDVNGSGTWAAGDAQYLFGTLGDIPITGKW